MSDFRATQPEAVEIFTRLAAAKRTQRELAEAIGIDDDKLSKVKAGQRQFKATEVTKALTWLARVEESVGIAVAAEPIEPRDYVPIEILPTFAGMGGGGTGDGDREVALVERSLIVDVLKGRPSDFILINVRGDSMEADFRHGDQLLVDRRDNVPSQPGSFALWDGEWGEYVVKNVERLHDGRVRVFSTNPKYSDAIIESEQTRIIGRPVWFGRRL